MGRKVIQRRIFFALPGGKLAFLPLAVPEAWALDDYVLIGHYELTEATDLGQEFLASFAVRIFNRGDVGAFNVTGSFENPFLPGTTNGDFPPANLLAQENVRLAGTSLFPEQQYRDWEKVLMALTRVEFIDTDGISRRGSIPLVPTPVVRED